MIRGWQIYRGQAPAFHQEIDYTQVTFWLITEADQFSRFTSVTNAVTSEKDDVTSGVKGGVKKPKEGGLETTKKTTKKTGKETGKKAGKKIVLTRRQREIVALLTEDNGRSVLEIAEVLNVGTSTVQEHFDNMKAKAIIRRMGPDKGGFWEVLIKM
jgi:predicted HTH transcriptional regulator